MSHTVPPVPTGLQLQHTSSSSASDNVENLPSEQVGSGSAPIQMHDTPTQPQDSSVQMQGVPIQPQEKLIHGGLRWLFLVALVGGLGYFAIQIVVAVVVITAASLIFSYASAEKVVPYALVFSQLVIVVVGLPLYRYLRMINTRRPTLLKGQKLWLDRVLPRVSWQGSTRKKVIDALLIMVVGLSLQMVISALLTLIEPFIPQLMGEYGELMKQIVATDWISVLALTIMAPVSEEIFFRGVAMEYARRSSTNIWLVIVAQALVFGIAHGNWIQGSYAFVIGVILGMICFRVGGLPSSMLAHFAINSSSFLVGFVLNPAYVLSDTQFGTGLVGVVAVLLVFAAVGILAFRKLMKRDLPNSSAPFGSTHPSSAPAAIASDALTPTNSQ